MPSGWFESATAIECSNIANFIREPTPSPSLAPLVMDVLCVQWLSYPSVFGLLRASALHSHRKGICGNNSEISLSERDFVRQLFVVFLSAAKTLGTNTVRGAVLDLLLQSSIVLVLGNAWCKYREKRRHPKTSMTTWGHHRHLRGLSLVRGSLASVVITSNSIFFKVEERLRKLISNVIV